MAVVTQDCPIYQGLTSNSIMRPPNSPPRSLSSEDDDDRATASSSTSSVDQLPLPAFTAEGRTPAPCEDHANMISHHSEIVLHDEDNFEDSSHHTTAASTSVFSDTESRPNSPSPARAGAVTASSNAPQSFATRTVPGGGYRHITSVSMEEENEVTISAAQRSDTGSSSSFSPTNSATAVTSFFTAPPPSTSNNIRLEHHNMPSPFSFFAHPTLGIQDDQNGNSNKPNMNVKTLKIELRQTEIVLVAGKAATLEGVLYVNLQKNTKVKSLQLEFAGRSSVTWVDDNAYSPATRHTTAPHIEHTWPLISHPNKKSTTILPVGQHAYPFSLELPDTLPETLTTQHGKVAYRLLATMTKPGITFTSSCATASVNILRRHAVDTPASRTYHRGGRIISAPEDKIQYKITLPQVRVPHSTKIPLQVSITSPNSRTTVQVLQVGLWERVVYRADGRKRVDMRLVKIQKSEGWNLEDRNSVAESVTWNKVLLFDMPPMGIEMNHCNPSADNGLMKVSHLLRCSVLGSDGTKRCRVENEIELKVLAFEDEYPPEDGVQEEVNENGDPLNELPSYLTSFSTPRVSFDSEREMDPADDDLLRALVARIHLPTYAESEEDTNSRNPSRDVSRSVSRVPSRSTSPERSLSNSSSHSSRSSSSGGPSCSSEDYASFPPPPPIHHPRPVSPHGRSNRLQDQHPRASHTQTYHVRAPTPLRSS